MRRHIARCEQAQISGDCTQSCGGQGCDHSERATRIELALSAWEAEVLPLNYARMVRPLYRSRLATDVTDAAPAPSGRPAQGCCTSSTWVNVWCSKSVASTVALIFGTPPVNDRRSSISQSIGSEQAGHGTVT